MATNALGDTAVVRIIERFEHEDIAIERDHRVEIDAPYGVFA